MYKFIDHTADVAFEAYGKDLAELLVNASYAFYEAFVDTDKLKVTEERVIEIEAEDVEMLLYKWLNELLYLLDTEFFAAKEVSAEVNENSARGTLKGGKITSIMVKVEPKAITLHKFKVERNDGWKAFVVIDI